MLHFGPMCLRTACHFNTIPLIPRLAPTETFVQHQYRRTHRLSLLQTNIILGPSYTTFLIIIQKHYKGSLNVFYSLSSNLQDTLYYKRISHFHIFVYAHQPD